MQIKRRRLQVPTYPHIAMPCIDLDQNERTILNPDDPTLTSRDMCNHRRPGSDKIAPPLIQVNAPMPQWWCSGLHGRSCSSYAGAPSDTG